MINRLNYLINLLNLFLIFVYFIFLNTNLIKIEFEFLLIALIIFNLLIKLYSWYSFGISENKYLNILTNNIFKNARFAKICIFILSIATPIYMIIQKDSLVINLLLEKFSFLLVFIFSMIGFYLEFFILESKSKK